MFDLGRWETWVVLVAILTGIIASLFFFKHNVQPDKVWTDMQQSAREVTVLVWAVDEQSALKEIRAVYREPEWQIIKYSYDADSKVWIFILRQRGDRK